MKKLLAIVAVLFFMFGCAAQYTNTTAEGVTMTMKNYVVTEVVYGKDGKIASSLTILPGNSIFEGTLDKFINGLKGILDVVKFNKVE